MNTLIQELQLLRHQMDGISEVEKDAQTYKKFETLRYL